MNKVLTINLNGRAYLLEEAGFDALNTYLAEASAHLAEDPGKTEILADLEQAIAEKCDKLINTHKTIVTTSEIKATIEEMGSVEGSEEANADANQTPRVDATSPKRLYRIREGSYIFGVCAGLAAYFGVDATLVRIAFLVLAVFTGGGFLFAYFLMMMFIPEADTMQEKAAASGAPFNAQELVNRTKAEYARWSAHFADAPAWRAKAEAHRLKRELRHQRRAWRAHYRSSTYRVHPLLGLLRIALALVWILALVSLIATGAIFGWLIPAGIPLWAAMILLFIVYHAVTGPMRAPYVSREGYRYNEWDGVVDGLGVLFLVIAIGWAYVYVPEVNAFAHHPIQGIEGAVHQVQSWF